MKQFRKIAVLVIALAAAATVPIPLLASPQQATAGATARSLGTVESIQGNDLTLKSDAGASVHVVLQDATRMLRVEPGQHSLSGATPLARQDLQVGDRVLVLGKLTGDGAIDVSTLVAIKKSDIAKQQAAEEEEWQKNGVGGLVKAVDPASQTVTIAGRSSGANKTITIHTSSATVFKRYAPGSVRFEDAKPGTFAQIQPGDQLRARGTLTADGTELAAGEIVSGSFQNIAGPVTSVDPGANEITVMDRLSKHPVVVKFTDNSLLHNLPQRTAQEIAARLRPEAPGKKHKTSQQMASEPAKPQSFSQLVRGLPTIGIGDLRRGEVVMVVATQSAPGNPVTAVNLVSGAGPILPSATSGGQSQAMQSLWAGFSTSAGGGGGGGGESSGSGGGNGGSSGSSRGGGSSGSNSSNSR